MGEPVIETKTSDQILDGIFGKGGEAPKAPAVIGKPVYESDLKFAEMVGVKTLPLLFGQRINEKTDSVALPLNFGSKASVGHMPDDVRLRLFHMKKLIHNVEVQAQVKYPGQFCTPAMMMETDAFKYHLAPMLKAYNITDFSTWIQTVNARFYFSEYEIPYLLADQFDQIPMDAPTVEVPGELGLLEGVEETDTATFGEQTTTAADYSVTSRNNVVHAKITQDLLSDSAPAYIERMRKQVMMGTVRSYEKAIINGDVTGSPRGASHQDSDTAALALNATFSKAFSGIRKLGLANTANGVVYDHGGDSPSKTMFAKVMNAMGDFASEKDDLFWLVPSSVENMLVTGAIPELFTAFAFGGLASNVTGQCPPVFGIKVLTSKYVRQDLNASGVYAAASTLTHIALVKKSRFANWMRQATRIWAAPSLPSSDHLLMSAKTRHAWAGNPQSAVEKSIALGINVART